MTLDLDEIEKAAQDERGTREAFYALLAEVRRLQAERDEWRIAAEHPESMHAPRPWVRAINNARAQALEEAARAVEALGPIGPGTGLYGTSMQNAMDAAAAIRALKP